MKFQRIKKNKTFSRITKKANKSATKYQSKLLLSSTLKRTKCHF